MSASAAIDLDRPDTWPSRRVEDWRWTDLRRVLRQPPAESAPLTAPAEGGPFAAIDGETLLFANGKADGRSGAALSVADTRSLKLRFLSTAGGGHQPRVSLTLEPDAELLLLESYEGAGDYVSNVALDIRLKAGARLTRVAILADAPQAISLSLSTIALESGAQVEQTVLTSGARLQRHETRLTHLGPGAKARLDSAYAVGADGHADLTTEVRHLAQVCETRQLTKGVVAGRGRAVFQGRILVEAGADGSDARLGHHGLILSDRAEIDAKPELQIFADDVACAHGNTIGALDPDALFYAMARGLSEPEAKAMLTRAFVGEALDRIRAPEARAVAEAWADTQLAGLQ